MFSNLYKVIKKTVDVTTEYSKATVKAVQKAKNDWQIEENIRIMNHLATTVPVPLYGHGGLTADQAVGVDYDDYQDPPVPNRGSLPCAPLERMYSEFDILTRLRPPAWHQFSITEAERSVVVVEDPTMSFCEARRSCQLEVVFQPLASVGKALEEELTHRVIVPLPATIVHKIVFLACGKSDVLPP